MDCTENQLNAENRLIAIGRVAPSWPKLARVPTMPAVPVRGPMIEHKPTTVEPSRLPTKIVLKAAHSEGNCASISEPVTTPT